MSFWSELKRRNVFKVGAAYCHRGVGEWEGWMPKLAAFSKDFGGVITE